MSKNFQLDFELRISYFFGCRKSEDMMRLYISGLKLPYEGMLDVMCEVYEQIEREVSFSFNTRKAAQLECEIIKACREFVSMEVLTALYQKVYSLVFGKPEAAFHSIAKLRSFIFSYQQEVEEIRPLTEGEKELMISAADLSASQLSVFENACGHAQNTAC